MPCVIKYDHDDGVKLRQAKIVTWCGKKPTRWMFEDAQHAAFSVMHSRISVCRSCRKNIKDALDGKLEE